MAHKRTMLTAISLGVWLAASIVRAEGGAMFERPVWVPADFLYISQHDESWLLAAAEKLGVRNEIEIGKGMIGAKSLAALKALNRIRAFTNLQLAGRRAPYLDLTLKSKDGSFYRCVTPFPRSIVPGITASDFGTEWFPDDQADPAILRQCRVTPEKGAEFTGLDRDTFRSRYFGEGGHLNPDYAELNTNPAFVAEAFDHGFLIWLGDLTGRLQIDAE